MLDESIVRDRSLAPQGKAKIEWAAAYMPLLNAIRAQFEKERPFAGMTIAISIHLEAKTAYLAHVLRAGGAQVVCTGCNPLSTQDSIAASLVEDGFSVYAVHGVDMDTYQSHLDAALACKPHLILDDGGDLLGTLHTRHPELGERLIAGTEETTTGVMRMRRLAKQGELPYPMMAVNDARCKHLFDNRYGTGQSTMDAIMRNTNLLIAGKRIVVGGYGWCARGIAMRAKGLGARVVVTEVDAVRALEAAMDGFEVMAMADAATVGDIFITATGCKDIITGAHMQNMKDGALLCNAGHFDVEINKQDLQNLSVRSYESRPNIMAYQMADGRVLHLLADGRLVNIAAADGHPIEIMDMSFAVQALSLAYLAKHGMTLQKQVYSVPEEIDQQVAQLKVHTLGMTMDTLTHEQAGYIGKEDA